MWRPSLRPSVSLPADSPDAVPQDSTRRVTGEDTPRRVQVKQEPTPQRGAGTVARPRALQLGKRSLEPIAAGLRSRKS